MSAQNALRAGIGLLCALMLVGCAQLPESGSVHRESGAARDTTVEAPYFAPPGPMREGSVTSIATGFLLAMQANPLSTSVAREFLSRQAGTTWKPNRGTITYEGYTVQPTAGGAVLHLTDTRRLDARGGWLGGELGTTQDLDLRMTKESGQWRIENPPDALVVPVSYFESNFQRFNLWFYDQTDQVLLPDPVFIPRGEQSATNLVRGLLAGPPGTLRDIMHSAFPDGSMLSDLSVVVTESGVAEVPVSDQVLDLSPAELRQAVLQLAWTLRQVPGIQALRLSADGSPVPLPDGRNEIRVSEGSELDPAASGPTPRLVGLRDQRLVDLSVAQQPPIGPLSQGGFALRAVATSSERRTVAAVADNGRELFVAPITGTDASSVVRVLSGADLLRPSYDVNGNLWVVDRAGGRARVWAQANGRARRVRVPGVTGRDVSACAVSRDGSRIAFVLNRTRRLLVADVLRTSTGAVVGIGATKEINAVAGGDEALLDVGWRDAGTLAVLTRTSTVTSRVVLIAADGSPDPGSVDPSLYSGTATELAVSSDKTLPLYLLTADARLVRLTSSGQWEPSFGKVTAATWSR